MEQTRQVPTVGSQWLALEHSPERVVGRDALSRGLSIFPCRLTVAEREADEEALAHLFLAIRHGLERLLLIMDLLVLGHVSLVAKVVKVASICLRVQLGHEWRSGLPQ